MLLGDAVAGSLGSDNEIASDDETIVGGGSFATQSPGDNDDGDGFDSHSGSARKPCKIAVGGDEDWDDAVDLKYLSASLLAKIQSGDNVIINGRRLS